MHGQVLLKVAAYPAVSLYHVQNTEMQSNTTQ